MSYAELNVTTNFSFLRGASHAEELVAQAKALGLPAIAITDRNTLAGVVRAHVTAKELGLKLVIGARLDLEDGLSLLCYPKDRKAYGRLSRLLSLGQARAQKGQCILYVEDVAAHAEGQIFIALPPETWDWREATSLRDRAGNAARPSGADILCYATAKTLGPGSRFCASSLCDDAPAGMTGQARAADATVSPRSLADELIRLKAVLGSAPLYLAASHVYRGEDRARFGALGAIAEHCATPLVATNEVLYHAAHRRNLQDVLTCVREHTTITRAGFRLQANAERHLKRPAEIARLFRGYEAALVRTLEIANACTFSLDELVYEYPEEPVPPGKSAQQHLEDLTWEGAEYRFSDGIPGKVRQTIERELKLIAELNYAPYFLTVHDIVTFARGRGILCQGRGSAANSIVCYCLSITAVNPTEVDLLFERFISESRREPPDIDVDFEHERREEVIQYIYGRYGRDRAGLAATVISYRARSAVRDVGKAMGLSEDTVSALAGMVWGTRSGGTLPEKHVREAGLDPADPLLATVLDLAEELMGFPRHLSQHVGGFVLTRGPLIEVVPVGNAAMDNRTFIEWDKDDIAALGLLKVDVLALGMLTCIRKAFDLLEQHHGLPMTLAKVPRGDGAVYDMLCRADSLGVFQVESRAQMNMLPRLKPRCFYDLVIEVAIVRPGPIQGDMVHPYLRRRSGIEKETYPAPSPEYGDADELRQILGKTKGVPLFQEQAMRIAMDAAKFTDAEVNELRKAMATFRRRGTIGLLEEKMVTRMVARGYDRTFAERCFAQIKGFGEYGFPESHAASFAHLVYVSSWLKCHYPAAFACALLNSQPMGFYAPAQIVRDARDHGVEVLAADINRSDWDCSLEVAPCDSALEVRFGCPPASAHANRPQGAKPPPPCGEGQGWGESRTSARVTMPGGQHDEKWPPGTAKVALRLGMRQIDGLAEADAHGLVKARISQQGAGFISMEDVWTRAGVKRGTLEKFAAADAFRSMGLDRRQALWEVRRIVPAPPLPLFKWSEAAERGEEPEVALPSMALSEHVVHDYQTLRLSLKAHPMSFLREDFKRPHGGRSVVECQQLRSLKDGARVSVAGVVLVRQRPGSAKGVVFMTIEDETGVANAVVWPKMLEAFRKVVMTARLVEIEGRIQRHDDIIHVVAARLIDCSDWLLRLSEWAETMKLPLANADEVLHPEPGSARGPATQDPHHHPPFARELKPHHPRNVRIIPKSRDFH
jgi:error-prone DNA polymerase